MGRRSSSSHSGTKGGRPPDPVFGGGDPRKGEPLVPPSVNNQTSANLNKARRRPGDQLAVTKEVGIGKPEWKSDGKSKKGRRSKKATPVDAEDYSEEESDSDDLGGDMETDAGSEENEEFQNRIQFDVLNSVETVSPPIIPKGNTAYLSKNWESKPDLNVNMGSVVNEMLNVNQNLKVSEEEVTPNKENVSDIGENPNCVNTGRSGWKNINPDSDFIKGQGFRRRVIGRNNISWYKWNKGGSRGIT